MLVLMELKKLWPKSYFSKCISFHVYFSGTVLLAPLHPLATSNFHKKELCINHVVIRIEALRSFHDYIISQMSHVCVLGKSSHGFPFHRVKYCTACRRVPRMLPKLAARRPEGVIEKVMSSASNMEKVGFPLPKLKEKVEKRGKYLKAVVDSLVALGQGGKVRSYGGIVARMQIDLPWDNKRVGLALKAGVEEGVLDSFSFKDWQTGKGSGCYKLSRYCTASVNHI